MAWWLLVAALPSAVAIAAVQCGKSRETAHAKPGDKSGKSSKSAKSVKSGASAKGGKSSKSGGHSSKSAASKKSTKSKKSSKGSKPAGGAVSGEKRRSKSAEELSSKSKKDKSNKDKSSKDKSSKDKSSKDKSGKSKSGKSKSNKSKKSSKSKVDAALLADGKAAAAATKPLSGSGSCEAVPVPAAAAACPPCPPVVVPRTIEVRSDPTEVAYKPSGGMHHVNVVNESAERRAFKVKCSDNQLYRVNPVYGVVEPGQSVKVDILRQNGSAKVDKLVILTGKAGTFKDGKEAFAQSSPAEQHMLVVPLLAAEA